MSNPAALKDAAPAVCTFRLLDTNKVLGADAGSRLRTSEVTTNSPVLGTRQLNEPLAPDAAELIPWITTIAFGSPPVHCISKSAERLMVRSGCIFVHTKASGSFKVAVNGLMSVPPQPLSTM